MRKIKSIKDIKVLEDKTVLLRADYNVHFEKKKIVDAQRIVRTYQTIDYLIKQKAKIVIISHLGRPEGRRNPALSLRPVAEFLKKRYTNISFINDSQGVKVEKKISSMKIGDILLLENVRFYDFEISNDQIFAKKLAKQADYFVNDAFGVSHRKHASVYAITEYIDSYAGFNLLSEIKNIHDVITNFKKPAIAIIGGVKISTKIHVIEKFLSKFKYVLIGGALANNFLINKKANISKSFYQKNYLKISKHILNKYGSRIILPVDFIISRSLKKPLNVQTVETSELNDIKNGFYVVDIGPKTIKLFKQQINDSETIVWNGPLGLFEIKQFAQGTNAIARAFANHVKSRPYGLVGGGETISVINNLGLAKKIDFISTGGGAMLQYIENGSLPALEKLYKKQ